MTDFIFDRNLYPQLLEGNLPDEMRPSNYFTFRERGFPQDPMAIWTLAFAAGYIRAVEMVSAGRAEVAEIAEEVRKLRRALEAGQPKTGDPQ